MFEILFKYPQAIFSRGTFVFANGWPVWLLWASIIVAAAGLGLLVWRRSGVGLRAASVWLLQSVLAALLLFMLWHPALSVATLRPQQNIVAVVVDDSGSMSIRDEGSSTRKDKAISVLNSGILNALHDKFQVRLYKMSDHLERIDKLDQITAAAPATHISNSLKEVLADAASLPIGAVVVLSDGADNSGGVDLETISEIRRQRIPVHTIGFGREQMAHDLEITGAELAPRVLPDSRLGAVVTFHQHGYSGDRVKLNIKDGPKLLASKDVVLKGDGVEQVENVLFNAGAAGVKTFDISIDPLSNEENNRNNKVTRLVNVDARKPRILYLEGEPRWEFKFLRRAVEEDRTIDLFTILRTTQNKVYRQEQVGGQQGLTNPKELEDGFPTKVEDLFGFDGVILGSVDAPYLNQAQQELLRQFVDRRGGGLLFLGGKDALSDGGYSKSVLSEVLPTILPDRKNAFVRMGATVELTKDGRDNLITRIEEDPDKNVERWKKLPYVMNFQDPGQPKPGAIVLVDGIPMGGGGARFPLLTIQNFGRGRTAVFATGGSWRWQMLQPVADKSHEMFYQQLLRWLVSETPRPVIGSTPRQLLADESNVKFRAEVRDKAYSPAGDALVEAHILGPDGIAEAVEMRPEPLEQGVYSAEWTTPKAGSYLVEMVAKRGTEELGRDVLTFRREDGVAENFKVEQNKELLQKLSSETGGRYYTPDNAKKLPEEISFSEAGVNVRETRDLWDMPVIFLLLIALRSSEWLLRRRWGVI